MTSTKSGIKASELVEYLENAWNIDKDDELYENYIDKEWVEYAIRQADIDWEGEGYYVTKVGYTAWEPTYICDQIELAGDIYSAYTSTYNDGMDLVSSDKVA